MFEIPPPRPCVLSLSLSLIPIPAIPCVPILFPSPVLFPSLTPHSSPLVLFPPSSPPPRFQPMPTPTPNTCAMSRVPVRYVTGTLLHALTNPSPLPPRLLPTPLHARPATPLLSCPHVLSPPAPAPVKRTTGGMGKSWELAPRSDYQFCQYISPSIAHDSSPCNCMLSPSPFGPFH